MDGVTEKTFTFTVSRSADKEETYMLRESELEQTHIDLLLGELLKRWEDSPVEVQRIFMDMLVRATREKSLNERFFKDTISLI